MKERNRIMTYFGIRQQISDHVMYKLTMSYYQTSYMDITEHSLHRQKYLTMAEGTIAQIMTIFGSLSTININYVMNTIYILIRLSGSSTKIVFISITFSSMRLQINIIWLYNSQFELTCPPFFNIWKLFLNIKYKNSLNQNIQNV